MKFAGRALQTLKEMAQSCRYFYEDFSEFGRHAGENTPPGGASAAGSGARQAVGDYDWSAENVHHAIQATADELEVGWVK